MNMHVPQSLQSAVELKQIAAIPKQIINAAHSIPLIFPVQDTLVGLYKITGPGIKFNRREMFSILSKVSTFDGELPEPTIENDEGNKRFWSGHQAISIIMPEINLIAGDDPNIVEIVQGELLRGQINLGVSKTIVHIIYNDFGAKVAKDYLNNLQFLMTAFLIHEGFSVGIGDLMFDQRVKKTIRKVVDKAMTNADQLYNQIHQGTFADISFNNNAEAFEAKISLITSKALTDVENLIISTARADNRILYAIKSGAKGSAFNICSMSGLIGQQNMDNKRLPLGFSDKTRALPHYYKYDDGLVTKGFIANSFIDGLTPQEFFFHAMSGREGLIDTAVKTAESGYIQRRLMKALEDMKVHYDYTVRSATGDIYQFIYGEDGNSGSGLLEKQPLKFLYLPFDKLSSMYRLSSTDKWELYMKEPAIKRMQKIKDWKDRLQSNFDNLITIRDNFITQIFQNKYETNIMAPFNLERLIINVKAKFNLNTKEAESSRSDLTPFEIEDEINHLIDDLFVNSVKNKILIALIMFNMAPKELIFRHHFNKTALNYLTQYIRSKYQQTKVNPGEMVGPLAAQSIGEISTQLTLNTFHTAGKAVIGVSTGVPRLKELMANSKKIKTPSVTAYLDKEYSKDKLKALTLINNLQLTTINDIISSVSLYLDSNHNTDIDTDKTLIDIYKIFGEITDQTKEDNPWILRVKFNRNKMMERNITMNDLYLIIQQNFTNINCVYNDDNAGELIMRIKLEFESDNNNADKDIVKIKEFEQKFISTIIKGIPGISHVMMDRVKTYVALNEGNVYAPNEEWILVSNGSNLEEVLIQEHIDTTRTISNDINEVYEIFGIEAARSIIYKELAKVINLTYRHVGLLSDFMTNKGYIMPIDRHGINRGNAGPLAKSSFEETIEQLLNAGVYGKVDNMDGVSANIMMGQLAPAGTGFPQFLLDEKMLMEEMKKRPIKPQVEKADDQAVVDKFMNISDYCNDGVGINFSLDNVHEDKVKLSNIPKVMIE